MNNSQTPYQKWFKQALNDLTWTKANINEQVWYGACFTAQQAAEKALKAYLSSKNIPVRKIHDLSALVQECIKIDNSFESIKEKCVTLTNYYAPSRYPDIAEYIDFTKKQAEEAYQYAKDVIDFINEKLS